MKVDELGREFPMLTAKCSQKGAQPQGFMCGRILLYGNGNTKWIVLVNRQR